MKKCLKVILSFSLMMSATGCNIIGGLTPNSSSSSIYIPSFSGNGNSSGSSSQGPSSSVSTNVSNSKEFNIEVVKENGQQFTVGLKEYDKGVYYTTEEINFSYKDILNIKHKYLENMNFGTINIDSSYEGYNYVKFLISNPDASIYSLDYAASLERYNPYESYSVIGSFSESSWNEDCYLYRQDDNRYLSDPLFMPAGTEYKVRKGSNWNVSYGKDNVLNSNENFVIEKSGTYHIELKRNGDSVEINPIVASTDESVMPIKSILNLAKLGQINSEKTYIIEGIVVARDSSNRPYIMDNNGDVILVYNTTTGADLGDKIKVKGNISIYNNLIQFGYKNFELIKGKSYEPDFSYLNNYVEYVPQEYIYLSESGLDLNNQLIKLSNLTLVYDGKYFNFATEYGTIIQSNANLEDIPFINENNVGKKVVVYGYYYGNSSTRSRIVPIVVEEDLNHTHVYSREEYKEPTCEEKGYLRNYCDCGDYVNVEIYSEKGHNMQNYYCSECGYCDYTDSLTFTYDVAGNSYTVTGVGEIHNGSLVIPDYYNGSPVTAISSYVFLNNDTFSSVYIPDTVSTIGVKAFYGCNSLLNVYYRGSQEQWDQISIEGGNKLLSSANLVLVENAQHVHDYQPILTWYPERIDDNALEVSVVCSKDSSHVLDPSEYSYYYLTLEHCPSSCMSDGYVKYQAYIQNNDFFYEEEVYFDLLASESDNHVVVTHHRIEPTCVEEGYIRDECICGYVGERDFVPALGHDFDENGKCRVCNSYDYTIGLKFELIDGEEAYKVTGYEGEDKDVVIPALYFGYPVTTIGTESFANCENLETITIPRTITLVEGYAFPNCNNLHTVFYQSNQENWNNIEITEYWNSNFYNAKIEYDNAHYHDYQPVLTWYPERIDDNALEVVFVCTEDDSHILDPSEYSYYYLTLEHRPSSCMSDGYVKYKAYIQYDTQFYEEEAYFDLLAADSDNHVVVTHHSIEPTCEEEGYIRDECICGYVGERDFVPALGHDLTKDTEFDNENHYQVTVCSRCNYREVNVTEPHNFNETYVKYPTETEDGLLFAECLGCDYEFETLVPALGHTHDYQPTFIWSPDFAPELVVEFVCSKDSSHILSSNEFTYGFDILEHRYQSCVSEGYIKYHGYATYNGVTYEEDADFVLPINGAYHTNVIEEVFEPTCEEQGFTRHSCECGYSYETNYTPALGHDYVNGYCNNCNQEEYTEGLEFTYDAAWDAYFVTGYHGVNSNVVIPSKYNNLDVIIIAENAFNGCEIIESIKIPSSINTIQSGAFIGTSITELEIPNSVTSIGSNIFDYNTKIEKLVVPFIGSSSDSQNMFNYFYDVEAGHAMVYPESIKTIEVTGEYEILEDNSFYYVGGVGGIENINITGCMSEVGVQTFAYSGASVLDLSNIGLISYQALYYANIETLILGDKLFKVDDNAFDYANITNIYYKGSKEDFDRIFANISLSNVNVVYNYIPDHIHDYSITKSQTPTCEEEGYLRNYCECGEYEEIETYPALGHDLYTYKEYTDVHHYDRTLCNNCDYMESTDPVEHILIDNILKEPTETEEGEAYVYCSECEYNFYHPIPSMGHTHNYQPVFIWNPDEVGLLSAEMVCSKDNSHVDTNVNYWYELIEYMDSECTSDGYYIYLGYIEYQGTTYYEENTYSIPAHGHYFVNGYCSNCNHEEYTEGLEFSVSDSYESFYVSGYYGTDSELIIPAYYEGFPVEYIGNYNSTPIGCGSITSLKIPETVKEIGSASFDSSDYLNYIYILNPNIIIGESAFNHCPAINTIYYAGSEEQWNNLSVGLYNDEFLSANVIYNYNPNHTHNFNIQQSQTPTCETPGYLRNYCECGEYEEIETYSALGHDYQFTFNWDTVDSGLINVMIECKNDPSHTFVETVECSIQSYQEPTCAEDGIITYYAFYDYNTFIHESTFEVFVPAVEHNFDDEFVCVNCGFHYYTDGLSFAYDESNDCYSVFEYTGSDEIVIIPDEYEGKPVTRIDEYAFTNSRHITSVRFSDNIEYIGGCAFQGCDKIEYMDLPDSLVSTDYGAFWGVSSLKEITLPEGFVTLGAWTFAYCEDLESAKLPESLEKIYGWAFMECHSLTSIEIPANVNLIDMYAFGYCESLTTMIVDENNKTFDSRDNCNAIIKTETNSLLHGCSNSSIPSTVTMIDLFAFYGCSTLTNIEIPENITTIGACAFQYCDGLQWIVLHEGLQNIDSEAFDGCVSLQDVYYTGSSYDWESITISDSNNRHLLEAQMVYNYEHGETHEYKYRKEVSSTCCEGGIIYNYCVCGEYTADYLPPLGHVYTAENIYGDRIDGFNDFDHFDGTYNVYEKVITSNDTLVYTQLGGKPLIELREDSDEIQPYITISEVDASVITIVLYGYYDESTGIEYISSYLDVRLNDSSVIGDLVSENKISDTVTTYTYEYYVHSDEVGTLAIYNHFDANFLIESISFTE
ncbi:MAG: leucine-rich repeat protein [Bacilli bacterium]|nr:leucine-rich repeat protein [Bacilli bacterium]